ncbi:vWA domain-containing protein [Thermus filiformis]|uniref:VWFA domain-containing protein n=1 Tax=Thermus filiformis TaxID=276 RepID=A0A0A2WPM5_THEFI|nr:VWA domain-containing protein [Thermus filiformis]KGQ22121.2 hypothetical protein THFILI_03865 [Thermus filiformis]
MLWLLPLVLLLTYLLYRARALPQRPWAGVWLWRKGLGRGRRRPRTDLRLFLLLLAGGALVLALEDPPLLPPPLALVVDASASMAADEGGRTRLDLAKERARSLLERAPEAVLVRAGATPSLLGQGAGVRLVPALMGLEAGNEGADLEAALALARSLLPHGAVVLVSDAPPPPGLNGYLGVGSPRENLGIVRVAPGFLALGNSAPRPLTARLEAGGRTYTLEVPARGYRGLELPTPVFQARLLGKDALALDDRAGFAWRRVGVWAPGHPALVRLLRLLDALPGDEVGMEIGIPEAPPRRPTLFFAPRGLGEGRVLALRPHPALEDLPLLGERLPVLPPPKGWEKVAEDEGGRGLLYALGESLYLPPLDFLKDRPYFPALVYNFLRPYREVKSGLLLPEETLLPTPKESFLPRAGGSRVGFLLLALLALLLEALLWARRKGA